MFNKLFLPFLITVFSFLNAASQNVLLNILTGNSGIVKINGTVYLELTVCNTSSTATVPAYKLRPQVNVPVGIVNVPDTGHVLPAGWSILKNAEGVIRLSNGNDMLPPNECRTILIAMTGKAVGGPSSIIGNLLFSNGKSPGSDTGGPTDGDNPADNSSTTTIMVNR